MARPLIVTPLAKARLRAASKSSPPLSRPSPETSMTRRRPSKPLAASKVTPSSMAVAIDVAAARKVCECRLTRKPNALASVGVVMCVKGKTVRLSPGPPHCVTEIATPNGARSCTACKTAGSLNAAASPLICKSNSSRLMLAEASRAKTSSMATGVSAFAGACKTAKPISATMPRHNPRPVG